ncbi:MAG: hypothetical protein IKG96_00705 [Bacteroidaceae bacterium]|nr:hypothetical protein [Bacteroidaceae bacterium]
MKVSKVAQAIVWFSVLTAIFGGITIAIDHLYIGAAFIIVAVFMYGFSYIVQAAYVYIQCQPDGEEDEESEETELS